MSAADHGAELAARSRAAQQLPPHVEDVDVLARIAAVIPNAKNADPISRRPSKTAEATRSAIAS